MGETRIWAEKELVRHRTWRGVGRIVRIALVSDEIDVWWHSNGRVGMRTTHKSQLITARKTDVPPPSMEARR